jgi:hypothetical protein
MFFRSRTTRPRRSWLFAVLASLALAAQFVVALAPLAEGRQGRSMSAHVESGTTKGHYTHNEATCASCQARYLVGATARADVGFTPERVASAIVVSVDHALSAAVSPQTNPRAPPSVI